MTGARAFKKALMWGANLGWWKVAVGAAIVIFLFFFAIRVITGGSVVEAPPNQNSTVTVSKVSDLSSQLAALSIAGVVSSKSEATVRAESSGQVTYVGHQLGDYVAAGSIVAELENSSQRAAVLQAQGSLDAASASAGVSQTTLTAAKSNAVTALLSAYEKIDNAIVGDADPMFSNPSGNQPHFNVPTSDTQAQTDAQNDRVLLSDILSRHKAKSATLSTSADLTSELSVTSVELRHTRDFFDALIRALNAGIATNGVTQTTIDTFKATASADRAAITTALSSLTTAQQNLDTALKNSVGGESATSASAAAIKSAQGALAAAQANLEKTIIRAPISGTINSFSLKRGDFVQLTQAVLTVANNGALEIVSYVTSDDTRGIKVGTIATIEGGIKGVVTRIAPAIDPVTKKIEVRIGITDADAKLINGQSVNVALARTNTATVAGPITLPITAIKVGATEIDVFTIDPTTSTLVAHPVVIGELLGDRVTIQSGVTEDMEIVTDVRGFRAGQVVTVH